MYSSTTQWCVTRRGPKKVYVQPVVLDIIKMSFDHELLTNIGTHEIFIKILLHFRNG